MNNNDISENYFVNKKKFKIIARSFIFCFHIMNIELFKFSLKTSFVRFPKENKYITLEVKQKK